MRVPPNIITTIRVSKNTCKKYANNRGKKLRDERPCLIICKINSYI